MDFRITKTEQIPKKVCAIHDLSCLGRCALTVVMPILSQMGIQAVPLPTALLSTHTGGFSDFSFLGLTDEMSKIRAHFDKMGMDFDCVYSGFLGDEKQIEFVLDFAESQRAKNGAVFFADPVMGDDGIKYQTYTDEMCRLTRNIAHSADIITPNLTEACLLLGTDYRESFTDAEIKDMLEALSFGGKTSVVITGVSGKDGTIGARYFDRETRAYGGHFTTKLDASYPGTGDAFSSAVLGSLLSGLGLDSAVRGAVSYVFEAISLTYKMGTAVREGILLESLKINISDK